MRIKQPTAEELKAYRKNLGATQTDMANFCHVRVRTYQNWEGGTINIPLATWELLQYRKDDYKKRLSRRPKKETLPKLTQATYGDWTL